VGAREVDRVPATHKVMSTLGPNSTTIYEFVVS